MNKKEALDKFDPLRSSDAIYDFIEWLYEKGYTITDLASKEEDEHKGINE